MKKNANDKQKKTKTLAVGNGNSMQDILLDYALYIILGVLIIWVIIYDPRFVSIKNFTNILTQASTRIILALGVAGLIVLQGTDLSAGRILGLTAAISASLLQKLDYGSRMYPNLPQLNLIIPLIIALFVGAVFGLINGYGVAKLKIHAFIVTLGTQLIAYGLLQTYIDRPPLGAQPISTLDDRYLNFVNGSFMIGTFKIPYLILYALIMAIIMYVVWNKTTLGKNMFAIGGNPEAASVSGVNLTKNIIFIFIISGLLYGLAGFLEAGRIGSVTSNTGGTYELDAIAACVVGGVSFSGGVGTIPGVIIGAVILQFLNYGLNFIGINVYLQTIIKGIIIITAVAIDTRKYLEKK